LQRYALKTFAGAAVASITAEQCEDFLLGLVTQRSRQGNATDTLSPATVKHAWSAFGRVMKYAVQRGALTANPVDRVDFTTNHATGDHEDFEPNPLSAEEVAQLSAAISGELVVTPSGAEVWVPAGPAAQLPAYPVYGLMVTFLAYTGLRASENTGLEVRDLEFRVVRGQIRCTVHVRRTKTRKGGEWVTGTPKSKRSKRSVALPPWLAARMHTFLFGEDPNRAVQHPCSAEPTAPVWPSRQNCGGLRLPGQRVAVPFDWSQPMAMGTFYDTIMKPALVAVGLPASAPEVPATATTAAIPAQRGVRLHDLRHTFAVMQLMAGTHFMQVSKWLGHSTFTLTLNTYGDWIPEEDGGAANNLPEPVAPAVAATPQFPSGANVGGNVVSLFGRRSAG
ncbi:tyrosine-type recombinase/integrase, partial [Streptomyces californicus]